jgi:hypothetical protein
MIVATEGGGVYTTVATFNDGAAAAAVAAAGRKSSDDDEADIVTDCSLEDVDKSSSKSGMLLPLCSEGLMEELEEPRLAELNENLFKLILDLLNFLPGEEGEKTLEIWRSARSS